MEPSITFNKASFTLLGFGVVSFCSSAERSAPPLDRRTPSKWRAKRKKNLCATRGNCHGCRWWMAVLLLARKVKELLLLRRIVMESNFLGTYDCDLLPFLLLLHPIAGRQNWISKPLDNQWVVAISFNLKRFINTICSAASFPIKTN